MDITGLVEESAAEGAPDPWVRARVAARDIQRAVREATGLTCSIGVTPNKLLSKIASELEKPGGLTVLREEDIPARIWPLAVRKINGIGPKAGARLEAIGIRTIGELAQADPALLVAHFGRSYGAWMHEAAHGRDGRAVVTHSEPVSMSRETTFERDLHARSDRAELSRIADDESDIIEQQLGQVAVLTELLRCQAVDAGEYGVSCMNSRARSRLV